MSSAADSTLLILAESTSDMMRRAKEQYGDTPLSVLVLAADTSQESLPDCWKRLSVADFLDNDALRRDFLEFLDAWPRQPLQKGKSFDNMFRRREGYSVWWTGPGTVRHPAKSPFIEMKNLWICDRVIKQLSPKLVLICMKSETLAWSLASRCRGDGLRYEFLPGSAQETLNPWGGRLGWLVRSLARLVYWPCFILVRAVCARLLARTARESRRRRKIPAIIFASPFSRYSVDQGQISMNMWREVREALARIDPSTRCCYLARNWGRFRDDGTAVQRCFADWRLLRNLHGAVPVRERYLAFSTWLRSVPRHLASLFRYYRLEQTAAFQDSFVFAGADVSCLYVPRLRDTLAHLAHWAQTVETIVKSLRAAGNVKAMLVTEEMYETGMLHIAAARQLGIPTIGVQHGTIYPMHLIYTLPPGQVDGSPIPDYFAAYGKYAKETVSFHGSYPAERVWITGGLRFDHLVNKPLDASAARKRLGLPQEKRVVLMAATTYFDFKETARAVFEETKGDGDCLVCVKTHPLFPDLDVYRRLAQLIGAENVQFFNDRFDEL